jgi:hypothetical protein
MALERFLLERRQVIAQIRQRALCLLSPHGVTGLPATLFDF